MALDAYVWGRARLKYERALGIASTGHMIPEKIEITQKWILIVKPYLNLNCCTHG